MLFYPSQERDGESYMDFVRRAGEHPIGRIVKFFDLTDNLDMKRFSVCPDYKITKDDVARIKKFKGVSLP